MTAALQLWIKTSSRALWSVYNITTEIAITFEIEISSQLDESILGSINA